MNYSLSPRPSLASLTGVLVFSCFLCLGSGVASGQGLDDLFSQADDSLFADSNGTIASPPVRISLQDQQDSRPERLPEQTSFNRTADTPVRSASDLQLVDSPGSRPGAHQPTAMELRQARALAESRARMARLEAARWGLRPTLRPSWASDPMTASRFQNVQTYIVPVYVLSR